MHPQSSPRGFANLLGHESIWSSTFDVLICHQSQSQLTITIAEKEKRVRGCERNKRKNTKRKLELKLVHQNSVAVILVARLSWNNEYSNNNSNITATSNSSKQEHQESSEQFNSIDLLLRNFSHVTSSWPTCSITNRFYFFSSVPFVVWSPHVLLQFFSLIFHFPLF